MAYTTAAQISDYLQRALTTHETDWLAILIPAIQIWIDLKTNSTFDIAVVSSRFYDGGLSAIQIEPATEITEVRQSKRIQPSRKIRQRSPKT